jgi:16S rRNA (uracil1498-N3)-methyltransferase
MKPDLEPASIAKAPKHFIDAPLSKGVVIPLPANVAHHVGKVTRMKEKDAITLFNGDGNFYTGLLHFSSKSECSVEIAHAETARTESCLTITLLQGLASSEKMAWVIEKATELGVSTIVPVICQRSVAQMKDDKTEKKLAHWRSIAIAAAAQSGRARLPVITEPISSLKSAELAAFQNQSTCAVLDPLAKLKLSEWANQNRTPNKTTCANSFTLCIGPEGGLTRQELEIAVEAGFSALTLGNRILRTETAGPTAIAALQAILGDF